MGPFGSGGCAAVVAMSHITSSRSVKLPLWMIKPIFTVLYIYHSYAQGHESIIANILCRSGSIFPLVKRQQLLIAGGSLILFPLFPLFFLHWFLLVFHNATGCILFLCDYVWMFSTTYLVQSLWKPNFKIVGGRNGDWISFKWKLKWIYLKFRFKKIKKNYFNFMKFQYLIFKIKISIIK